MAKYNILILDNVFNEYSYEKKILKKINASIIIEKSQNLQKISNIVKNVDGILVNLTPLTKNIIYKMTKCKIISRYGVGYDNIDTSALKEKNIVLANVPDFCIEDVSDHTIALWLNCVRKISFKDSHLKSGIWGKYNDQKIWRTTNKIFGFIGFGKIAQTVYKKLSGFNLKEILIYDPYLPKKSIKKFKKLKPVDLKTLLSKSDYISIHLPLTQETKNLINEKAFKLMKENAILINTSRGPVIDEKSLIKNLKKNKIFYAGLDVFTQEPLPKNNQLKKFKNLILTNHCAWYSEESIVEVKTKVAQNIVDFFTKGKPTYQVKI